MSSETRFTVSLRRVRDYEFKVRFDSDELPDRVLNEPEPLGHQRGPSAARIVTAAVGDCLTASLLCCLRKSVASSGKEGMLAMVDFDVAVVERSRSVPVVAEFVGLRHTALPDIVVARSR